MSELSQLSPQPLWDIFAKICSIPHPSYHEEQLAEHILSWASEKGLHAERDSVGNITVSRTNSAYICCAPDPVTAMVYADIEGWKPTAFIEYFNCIRVGSPNG